MRDLCHNNIKSQTEIETICKFCEEISRGRPTASAIQWYGSSPPLAIGTVHCDREPFCGRRLKYQYQCARTHQTITRTGERCVCLCLWLRRRGVKSVRVFECLSIRICFGHPDDDGMNAMRHWEGWTSNNNIGHIGGTIKATLRYTNQSGMNL